MFSLLCMFVFQSATIDVEALAGLRQKAMDSRSDALLILKDGEVVVDWRSEAGKQPIELMSCVKSVVALGVARLLQQGKLDSLDQKVAEFYPEWRQGMKQDITIRHVLNHTSGIQNVPNAGAEIYPAPDAIQLAISADLVSPPGEAFSYNNKATNLLSGIIAKASGQRMDQYLEAELLKPLGISEASWYFDQAGNPHAMAGLKLHARDFAKIGELVLARGQWQQETLISADILDSFLAAGQDENETCGLLWWRLPRESNYQLSEAGLAAMAEAGVPEEDLATIRTLSDRVFRDRNAIFAALAEAFGDRAGDFRRRVLSNPKVKSPFESKHGPIVAYYAEGYLGNFLVIVPEANLVAVRMAAQKDDFNQATDTYRDFPSDVVRLIPSLRPR